MHGEMISLNAREMFLQRRTATRNGAARACCLLWRGVSGRWGGELCNRGRPVVERSVLMVSANFPPCSVIIPHKK